MARILRCPSCFTYVYDSARLCHGCGEKVRNRRLLTRGSWVFIFLCVTGFTVIRSVVLAQEKRDRERHLAHETEMQNDARSFLEPWLRGDSDSYERRAVRRTRFRSDLRTMAATSPIANAVPFDSIESWQWGSSTFESHVKESPTLVRHDIWRGGPKPVALTCNLDAPDGPSDYFRRREWWQTWSIWFRVVGLREGHEYEMEGRVCLSNGEVCCLQIDSLTCTADCADVSAATEK